MTKPGALSSTEVLESFYDFLKNSGYVLQGLCLKYECPKGMPVRTRSWETTSCWTLPILGKLLQSLIWCCMLQLLAYPSFQTRDAKMLVPFVEVFLTCDRNTELTVADSSKPRSRNKDCKQTWHPKRGFTKTNGPLKQA